MATRDETARENIANAIQMLTLAIANDDASVMGNPAQLSTYELPRNAVQDALARLRYALDQLTTPAVKVVPFGAGFTSRDQCNCGKAIRSCLVFIHGMPFTMCGSCAAEAAKANPAPVPAPVACDHGRLNAADCTTCALREERADAEGNPERDAAIESAAARDRRTNYGAF